MNPYILLFFTTYLSNIFIQIDSKERRHEYICNTYARNQWQNTETSHEKKWGFFILFKHKTL